MRKLIILMLLLEAIFSNGYGRDSKQDKKLAFYLSGGRSQPIGDLKADVKAGLNWGGGIEYRFSPSWSAGASVQKTNLNHKEFWYDSWNHVWRAADWTYFAIDLYGKYSFMKENLSPYLKLGVVFYSIESKNIFKGQNSRFKNRNTMISLIPALGCCYSIQRFILFVETNHNITSTKHFSGDQMTYQASQFVNLLLGVGMSFDI
jgi:hypothetical protein